MAFLSCVEANVIPNFEKQGPVDPSSQVDKKDPAGVLGQIVNN